MPLLTADILRGAAFRKLHGHHHQQLQHMVLEHVAQRTHLIIIACPLFHADSLGSSDLNIRDIAVLP
ncbi:hypothetical protein D3C75_922780 [compost metagenome]